MNSVTLLKKTTEPKSITSEQLGTQLKEQRRSVDFDTFDIHVQQLINMLEEQQISVAPAYQRKFRWDPKRCSQLIESLMLGIPVPSLFMATNEDNTWEVVDGVQRLSSIVKFAGSEGLRQRLELDAPLVLTDMQKLSKFEGMRYESLPAHIQQHFKTRPLKVITLNDKSDKIVRYDLFERLNTGGVALSPQEIRGCIFQGPFSEFLENLSKNPDFRTVVRLKQGQQLDGTAEECVLRFFAFKNRYRKFEHSVNDFLNEFMDSATKGFDYHLESEHFKLTFSELAKLFPNGLMRPSRKSSTPLNLFEGVAVGASLALLVSKRLDSSGLSDWMNSPELRDFTTGATNSRPAVIGRIEFCKDRFLGKSYVPRS